MFTPRKSPFQRLLAERKDAFAKLLTYYMNEAVKAAKLGVTGGGNSKTMLNVRSGRLRSSINKQVQVSDTTFRGIMGTNVVYAAIHEYGGTITPKKGRFLTIPLRHLKGGTNRVSAYSAVTNAGVARWSAGDLALSSFIGGREALGTFFKETKGKAFIFSKDASGNAIPIFRLVRSVTIPKRPYLTPALELVVTPFSTDIANAMETMVDSVSYNE
jgi:phage gpG-like protein